MLTDSQTNADRILNLKKENAVGPTPAKKSKTQETRYQCVVCQTNKVSLSELHWHQTYQHSTEELSLSVIGWKGLVKIVGPPPVEGKENTNQRSIYNSFSKKPSEFYYLSSTILRVKENHKGNTEAPIDCSIHPEAKVEDATDNAVQEIEYDVKEESSQNNSKEDIERDNGEKSREDSDKEDSNKISLENVKEDSAEDLTKDMIEEIKEDIKENIQDVEENIKENSEENSKEIEKEDIKSEVPSQSNKKIKKRAMKENANVDEAWQQELNTVKEISMEDFVKCANKLCSELEQYKRLSALKKNARKKHSS